MTDSLLSTWGAPDGQPVVWLGSLGSSTAMWDRQVAALGDDRRCVLVDHPGHGASPPAVGTAVDRRARHRRACRFDRSEVTRADVVGLSLGAMVAMWLAAEHPERIDRLALLCTCARFDYPNRGTTGRRPSAPVELLPSPKPSSAAGCRRCTPPITLTRSPPSFAWSRRPTPRATPVAAR